MFRLLHPCTRLSRRLCQSLSTVRSETVTLKIQVFSDTVCPWCWVGKHTLERVIGTLKNPPQIKLVWTPYLLDPKAGKDGGITVKDYYTQKYGPEAAELLHADDNPLIKAGADLGLTFNDQRRIVPTMTSHRLIELAQDQAGEGQAVNVDALVENLFVGYFVEAEDLSDVDILVEHGVRVGMPESATREFLMGNEGEKRVKNWDRHAKRKLKVPSVPHFVFTAKDGEEPVRCGGEETDLRAALERAGYS